MGSHLPYARPNTTKVNKKSNSLFEQDRALVPHVNPREYVSQESRDLLTWPSIRRFILSFSSSNRLLDSAILIPRLSRLKIVLDFRHKTKTTLYTYEDDDSACWFNERFLEILPLHAPTIAKVDLHIIYQHTRNESINGEEAGIVLKQNQRLIVKRVATILVTFTQLEELEVSVRMPLYAWGQVKNVAHFYKLNFTDWKLFVEATEGKMTEVEVGSALEKRIGRFAAYLKRSSEL